MVRNVYIVDDDNAVRAAVSTLLSLEPDLLVRDFASGDLFLAAAPQLGAGVVLLDFHMPGLNGADVLNALSKMPAKFATIVATGARDTRLAVQVMKLGAIDFIEKPYDVDGVLGALDAAFGQLTRGREAGESTDDARVKIASLSARERDVLYGMIDGKANKAIANELDISPHAVRSIAPA